MCFYLGSVSKSRLSDILARQLQVLAHMLIAVFEISVNCDQAAYNTQVFTATVSNDGNHTQYYKHVIYPAIVHVVAW